MVPPVPACVPTRTWKASGRTGAAVHNQGAQELNKAITARYNEKRKGCRAHARFRAWVFYKGVVGSGDRRPAGLPIPFATV